MKITNKGKNSILLMLLLGLLLVLPQFAMANSAEPPGMTVIILNSPEDLNMNLIVHYGGSQKTFPLQKEQRLWETYYRYYYSGNAVTFENLEQSRLSVISKAKQIELPLDGIVQQTYRNLMTLDLQQEKLIPGASWTRDALLVTMRLGLTLFLEGIIFWGFGFRGKRNWMIFLIINIATQIALNAMIHGPDLGSYVFMFYLLAEMGILLLESIAFLLLLQKTSKWRTIAFAATANLFSLALGGYLLLYLPV